IGASLARREGLRCWVTAQRRLAQGELPADSLLDGLLVLVAGLFLVTPGVLTDLAGFALLIPEFRRVVRRWLAARFRARLLPTRGPDSPGDSRHDEIIDVRIIDGSDDRDDSRSM
ncbi:MAG: FxsA family protein, partial [Pirellulaceae bacterium]|nr:FxsA family protein [Pirellulaceae bacterium]